MRFWRWGPWWCYEFKQDRSSWAPAGNNSVIWEPQLTGWLAADHQGYHVGMMNLKHIKITLLPKYLKMGGNHSNCFQSHGEAIFYPDLNFSLFTPWRFHCLWRLTEGQRRLWKISVAFQKHWCTANLLKACMCKSSHFCTWLSSVITCLLLRCLSQIGSDNCCLPLCGNKTDSQRVLNHSSCQTNLIHYSFQTHYRISGWKEWDSKITPDFNVKKACS